MFTIILSILFSTNVLAAPTHLNSTVQWSDLGNDRTLMRYRSNLLNHTMLPFLDECYPSHVSFEKTQILCALYFDGVLQLNSTNYKVEQSTIEKLSNESTQDKNFCTPFQHTFPAIKYYKTPAKNFHDPRACVLMCMEQKNDEIVAKPICTFLAWMGDEIRKVRDTTPLASANPSISPNNVSNVVTASKAESLESVKPVLPGVAAEKSEHISNIQKAPINQSTTSAQVSANKNPPALQNHPQVVVKQDTTEQKENTASAESAPAAPHTAEAESAAAAAAAGALPLPKVEKNQPPPVKEEEEPKPNTAEEEPPLRDLPTFPEKHDSLSIDQQPNEEQPNDDSEADPNEELNQDDMDDDTEDFEKPKPKDTPLASPDENEGDQKSSQEIIDRNYLPNTNHVTDPFLEESGSNFFTYFLIGMFLCIVLYVVYHNKSKILALLLEGRRNDKGRSGRRKHTAAYRKLDSNLEEAITSSASGRTTQIIY